MAQETERTRGESVCSALQDGDEIADLRFRELHSIGQQVERSAERTDDGSDFAFRADDAIGDDDRIVLADDLSEIAGGRQMVMQPAVGNQKDLPARNLAIENSAHVEPRLLNQIAAEFDDQMR